VSGCLGRETVEFVMWFISGTFRSGGEIVGRLFPVYEMSCMRKRASVYRGRRCVFLEQSKQDGSY
jgi:hypothetical protein